MRRDALARKDAVAAVERRPVADVDADDAGARSSAIHAQHVRVVPEVVGVEEDADLLGRADTREHGVGVGERVDEPGLVALRRVHRLEADADARLVGRGCDARRAPPTTRSVPSASVRPPSGPGEARDALGLVRGEPPHRGLERPDALLEVVRALHSGDRERQDRGDCRHADGDAEAVLAQQGDGSPRRPAGSLNSHSPIASKPAAAYAVDVLRERRVDGRDLREREDHERPGSGSRASSRCGIGGFVSSFATR